MAIRAPDGANKIIMMMIMVLFRVGLQQASSISDMWLKGRKCSEWHFSPISAKGNVGWAPSYNPCGGKFLHESDRHCHLPQMAKHLKAFQVQDRPHRPPKAPTALDRFRHNLLG